VRIALLVEGKTEKAFRPHLLRFLESRLAGRMPRIAFRKFDGRIPKRENLRRVILGLLQNGPEPADAVIALTDVYTGSREFADADDAKRQMREWVGPETRFYPHVAQYDFEAWLIPFWEEIRRLAGSSRSAPSASPESINHDRPPSYYLQEIFRTGTHGRTYIKPRDANRILRNQDLLIAARECCELKAFLDTILTLCGAAEL
jgi:hypothetical protein